MQRLLDEGVGVDIDARWNAIIAASVALCATPVAFGERSAEATDDGAGKSQTLTALGLELAPIDDAARKSFKLKDSIKGVVIASVSRPVGAGDKGLKPGEVIEEVNQQAVETPSDVAKAIAALKTAGKKSAAQLRSCAPRSARRSTNSSRS